MDNKMTVKDALKVAYNELAQVNVPAELTFSIGVHVGKAIMILRDCIGSIEREEQEQEEQKQEEDELGEVDLGEDADA